MRFNIIGAGRLGKNLALSLMSLRDNQLVAVCNHGFDSAVKAVIEIGSGTAITTLADLPVVDLTFITTPDDSIATVVTKWANPSGIVVHCSGALGSDVLTPLKEKGCLVASIHPLRAFRNNQLQADAFQSCDCVVEGDEEAVRLLTTLFTNRGARVTPITASKKSTYHAAAVMASNYVVTLAGCAMELFIEAGLPALQAKGMTERMMQSSLTNIQNTDHTTDALTGPLARGDVNTISQHLHAIKTPHIAALYKAAGLATLPLTHLDSGTSSALRTLLNE